MTRIPWLVTGVTGLAAVLLAGILIGVSLGGESAPPTPAEQRAQHQAEAAAALAAANFSSGTVTAPVDGARDGRDVLASFYLYVVQGEPDKAMQYVVNPEDPTVQEAVRRILSPHPVSDRARQQVLERGVTIRVSVFSPRNPAGPDTRSPEPGRKYIVRPSASLTFAAGVTGEWSMDPVMVLTDEGWKVAGFEGIVPR